jgi:ferredoxin
MAVDTTSFREVFIGRFDDLKAVFRVLREFFSDTKFYGYKYSNNNVVFDEINIVDEIPFNISDIQRPGFYRVSHGYRFRHSYCSPKDFLLPSEHRLLTVSQSYEFIEDIESIDSSIVFFGIKSCDRKAIDILDRILYGKNPVYTKRRDSVKAIVVEECLEPGETCFCSAVNSGPTISKGFDIAYAKLDQDTILFKYGSLVGEKILRSIGLREADEDIIKIYLGMVEKAVSIMRSRIPDVEDIQKVLVKIVADKDLWDEITSRCVGCGNCNYVCPTCFCTEVVDRVEESFSTRVGVRIGCLTYIYGLVSGGHFRQELYTRYRHFVLHKYLFYLKQVGDIGCVGCGRCITWCPVGIDLRDTLKRLSEVEER